MLTCGDIGRAFLSTLVVSVVLFALSGCFMTEHPSRKKESIRVKITGIKAPNMYKIFESIYYNIERIIKK
jgi:hypothetical protein